MPAYNPEECDLLLFKVIESGDIEAALDLYEKDATFVVSANQTVTGHRAIRDVLKNMIGAESTGKLDHVTTVLSADGSIAFTRAKGSTTGKGPDGNFITTNFHSIEVVRKQSDGTWRIAIDDPSGSGLTQ